jgi:hypothetical protein
VFGGYSNIDWYSEKKKSIRKDGNTFIFSFNEDFTIDKFDSIQDQTEVITCKAFLPCFGKSLKLVSKCNKIPNTSELGINHEFP